jgi:hypothetical protein
MLNVLNMPLMWSDIMLNYIMLSVAMLIVMVPLEKFDKSMPAKMSIYFSAE